MEQYGYHMPKKQPIERVTSVRLNASDEAVIQKLRKNLGVASDTEIIRLSLRACAWWHQIKI